jgi:hypothetical protein
MGFGASLFLIAVGAIIAFAFNIRVGWLDLDVVGWVMMLAGVAGLVLTLSMLNRSRRITRTASTSSLSPRVVPPTDDRVVEERTTYDADRPI